jgi:hypothetical protein
VKNNVICLALMASLSLAAMGQEATFEKTRFTSVSMPREADVILTVTDNSVLIKGKKANGIDMSIPFASIDNLSYELAERHRVGEGAAVMVLSLGAGAILMATKSKSHWLDIGYHEGAVKQSVVLRLDKSEYQDVLSTLEHNTGKPIARFDAKSSPMNPTANSKDQDEVVPYSAETVVLALKPAMESMGCRIKQATASRVECVRALTKSDGAERTGVGGEKVTATLEPQGEHTRVRIATEKGVRGRVYKKNWSTAIYEKMLKNLQQPAVNQAQSQPS